MNSRNSNIAFSAIAIVLLQIIAVLLDKSTGFTFLIGVALVAFYQVYSDNLSPKELGVSAAAFIFSSVLMAVAVKELYYDRVCEIVRSTSATEVGLAISQQSSCLNTAETFFDLLSSNPITTWFFWLIALGSTVLSVLAYRKYTEAE